MQISVNLAALAKFEIEEFRSPWVETPFTQHESLLEASQFISTIEHRQGLKIACPEEIAYRSHYIDKQQLSGLAQAMGNSAYARYLRDILEDKVF